MDDTQRTNVDSPRLYSVERESWADGMWEVTVALPDLSRISAGMGSSNLEGQPRNFILVHADTAESLEQISRALIEASGIMRMAKRDE